MYSLYFLSSQELEQLRNVIAERVSHWLNFWTFSSVVSVHLDVGKKTHVDEMGEVAFALLEAYAPGGLHVAMSEVDWNRLIWGDFEVRLPNDEFSHHIAERVKEAFLDNVFNASLSPSVNSASRSTFADDLTIHLEFPGYGKIIVYTRQTYVFPMLGRQRPRLSMPKLEGIYNCLKDLRFNADIVLSLGQIKLSNLAVVSEGTVIESDASLVNSFHLRILNEEVLHVALGKQNQHLAALVKGRLK